MPVTSSNRGFITGFSGCGIGALFGMRDGIGASFRMGFGKKGINRERDSGYKI